MKTKEFADKKIMFVSWGCEEKNHYHYTIWAPYFKESFGKAINFSSRTHYYRQGKDKMNSRFIEILKKEKPDYLLVALGYDEFYPETLLKMREASPNTITIAYFGDDEWRYEDWSRFYAPYFDYILITETDSSEYDKDGIKNVNFVLGSNSTRVFKHMDIEKKYDVSFVGMPIVDRYDYLKFLHKNGIKVKIFGREWDKYSDIKEIYGGFLSNEDYVKTMNQTKINLSFSKGMLPGKKGGQIKGRVIECGLCKAFLLVESTERNIDFYKKHKELTFKTKEELLEKVKYYLGREKEREKFAQLAYDFVIKTSSTESLFSAFFNKIAKTNAEDFRKELQKINKKVVSLSIKDFTNKQRLNKKIANVDYVCFDSKAEVMKEREYFQAYSLEKSGKDISCCDYYANSNLTGDYLRFMAKKAFYDIPKNDFSDLIDLSQLMVRKDYFIKNLNEFASFAKGEKINIIDDKNTNFVSIPLVRIKKLKKTSYKSMKEAFRMLFLDKMYTLVYKKKLFSLFYPGIMAESLFSGKSFMLRYVYESLFGRDKWDRLNTSFIK